MIKGSVNKAHIYDFKHDLVRGKLNNSRYILIFWTGIL